MTRLSFLLRLGLAAVFLSSCGPERVGPAPNSDKSTSWEFGLLKEQLRLRNRTLFEIVWLVERHISAAGAEDRDSRRVLSIIMDRVADDTAKAYEEFKSAVDGHDGVPDALRESVNECDYVFIVDTARTLAFILKGSEGSVNPIEEERKNATEK